MTVRVGDGTLRLEEVHRFGNEPVRVLGTLHWDILRLYADVLDGLRSAARAADLASIGIDSWGVDYGLLGPGGVLLGNPVHYRDTRTDGVAAEVAGRIGAAELYAVTGIQQLPFNGSRRAGPAREIQPGFIRTTARPGRTSWSGRAFLRGQQHPQELLAEVRPRAGRLLHRPELARRERWPVPQGTQRPAEWPRPPPRLARS